MGWLKPFLDRLGHARDKGVTAARRMRIDRTLVETDIHHPTDGTTLRDGVRVVTRIKRKITEIAGAVRTKLRDRSRDLARQATTAKPPPPAKAAKP